MTRTLLLCSLTTACTTPAPSPLGVALTDACAVHYFGDEDIDLHASSADDTVSLWIAVTWPDASARLAGETFDETWDLADDAVTFHLYTGESLREPCSDVAMNEARLADYAPVSGTLTLAYTMSETDGELPGGTVEPSLSDLVIQNGDEDPLDYGDLTLGELYVGEL